MSVVLFHASMFYRMKLPENRLAAPQSDFIAGAGGVDIFFAISGFVMVITGASLLGKKGDWKSFLQRRFLRIVPFYWLMTVVTIGTLLGAGHALVSPWHTISSFLFIPAWNDHHEPFPVLKWGWTLPFEMLFYMLFAAALALRLRPWSGSARCSSCCP